MYPILEKFFAVMPILAQGAHKQAQHEAPAQQTEAPAQHITGRHI